MSTNIPRHFSDEAHYMGVVSNQYHHRETVSHDPFADCILPMGVSRGPVAPIFGFVPRMSNLKAVALETLRDDYDVIDKALTAGEIANALAAPNISELQFVHNLNGEIERIQTIPVVKWVYDSRYKKFCRFHSDVRVGIELPMSDYHWTGINTLGKRITLFVEKLSVVGNQQRKSLRLHLNHFKTVHVTSIDRPPAWTIYYPGVITDRHSLMDVEVFEFNRYGGGNVLLGKVPVLSNATPKYLVEHRTGNVYQLLKAETYLKVIHIGYVPPSIVNAAPGVSRFYSLAD